MYEMDTGLSLRQLMTAPGVVNIDALLTKSSPDLLPLLCTALAPQLAGSRCSSAAELLRILGASIDPLFIWQLFDSEVQRYVPVPPASSVFLEGAFSANEPLTGLPLPPPLDLVFDIRDLLSSSTALGFQTQKRSGKKCRIRRVLAPSVLNSCQSIPTWQELIDGKEWLQCSPAMCAKIDIDAKSPSSGIDSARYRYLPLDSGSICGIQLPHPMMSEPYLAPALADDIVVLNRRVHDSLPEWDVTSMEQVVNAALASKYAAYRHRVAARCNGNPNERMMFHFAPLAVIPKIWQQGEGHDPRLSSWAEVGKGAYFSKHLMYGYAYQYCLWPSPPNYAVKAEPQIGETMQVFASLVCLGNVADMGPGCETCPSPAWDAWKKEPPILPKPTRPPAMTLSADVAEKQHILDITQVKDVPRYDSVLSTEGDLGTHPASTNKDASGRPICDVMHPRLRSRAKEWAEQCVVFDTAASYPMFIATLTKTRDSPMGPQQLMDAGCDANRIKALGFTASDIKALGKTVHEMRAADWSVLDLKNAGFGISQLLAGGCSAAELKVAGFTASQMKGSGLTAQELRVAGYNLEQLRAAGFDDSYVMQEFSVRVLKNAGFTAVQLSEAMYTPEQLRDGGFSAAELKFIVNCDPRALIAAGYSVAELRKDGFTAVQLKDAGMTDKQLMDGGFLFCKSLLPCKLSNFWSALLWVICPSWFELKCPVIYPYVPFSCSHLSIFIRYTFHLSFLVVRVLRDKPEHRDQSCGHYTFQLWTLIVWALFCVLICLQTAWLLVLISVWLAPLPVAFAIDVIFCIIYYAPSFLCRDFAACDTRINYLDLEDEMPTQPETPEEEKLSKLLNAPDDLATACLGSKGFISFTILLVIVILVLLIYYVADWA
jgi:hypothetical protein